jgi:TRAP-type C4-dicarboxylate transport system permease small subunit
MTLCAEKTVRLTSRTVFYLGSATLLIIMVLVTLDVGGRYLFNKPLLGVNEICEFMLAGAVLLGLAYTQILRGHVMVELLYDRLSPKTQAILALFHCLIGMFIFGLIAWQSAIMTYDNWQDRLTSDILRIPAWPFRSFAPVGAFLLTLELFVELVEVLKKLRKGEE